MSTYETVLEYLYAKEMVEGIEHAHAVMHELDADEIQYIVEEKVKDKQDVQTKVDPSKAKRLNMMKRQILQKKVQAVRQGAGADVTASYEPEGEMVEGVGDAVKKGLKRHKDAVEKKKIKNRKAVPYAALAAQTELEGDDLQERCTAKKPSELAKKKKLSDILAKKDALKEMWGKKKTEKKPQKAMDAGARAKRKLQRREYAAKVSGSEDNVPDEMREGVVGRVAKAAAKGAGKAVGFAAKALSQNIDQTTKSLSNPDLKPKIDMSSKKKEGGASAAKTQADKAHKARVDARKKAIKKIKDDRRERASKAMTADKAANKVKKEAEDKKFISDSEKPIVAEFVDNLWEASKKKKKKGCDK